MAAKSVSSLQDFLLFRQLIIFAIEKIPGMFCTSCHIQIYANKNFYQIITDLTLDNNTIKFLCLDVFFGY